MNSVYDRFIRTHARGMRAVRVVPKSTTIEDLAMFKLDPTESLSLFDSKNRRYVELTTRMPHSPEFLNQRLNKISAYLKALNK